MGSYDSRAIFPRRYFRTLRAAAQPPSFLLVADFTHSDKLDNGPASCVPIIPQEQGYPITRSPQYISPKRCIQHKAHYDSMSLLSCFAYGDGGEVDDVEKYLQQRKRMNPDSDDDLAPPSKKHRLSFPKLARRTEDGDLEVISPTDSIWYLLYVSCPNVDCKRFQRKFCRRFCMPYESFRTFCLDARAAGWFPWWMGCDATGKQSFHSSFWSWVHCDI